LIYYLLDMTHKVISLSFQMLDLRDSVSSELCEYTIKSFKDDYMKKPWYTRAFNASVMVGRSICLYTSMISRSLQKSDLIVDPLKYDHDTHVWKPNTKGLYVVVHGLLGTPKLSALSIANYIETHYKDEYDIIVPIVPHKGNCTLEEASNPILNIIVDFIDKNPTKPIHLIGSSNGGRIVAYLEVLLRSLRPSAKIKITGVGGVYYGSNALCYLKATGLARCILHEDIIRSLTTGSDNAISLINSMQTSSTDYRTYEFYATANDWYIPNFDSCYPSLPINTNVTYHPPITGVDHVLLGHYLAKDIIENSVIWMNENNMEPFN
jgi:hypothetical protein